MKVTIYTTATCVFCRAEKQFLEAHRIPYETIAADEDQAAAEKLMEISGQLGVPFTIIQKDDGGEEHILGFDQPKLTEALGL